MVNEHIASILKRVPSPSELEGESELLQKKYGLSPEATQAVADVLAEPATDILSDLPTNEDAFGFKALVRTIANVATSESTQTPLTICVDGEWGSGKTSFLKMIEAQAKMLGFHCLWLNAWKLENTQQFFLAVADALLREFNLYETSSNSPFGRSESEILRNYIWEWTESPFRIQFDEVFRKLWQSEQDARSRRPELEKEQRQLKSQLKETELFLERLEDSDELQFLEQVRTTQREIIRLRSRLIDIKDLLGDFVENHPVDQRCSSLEEQNRLIVFVDDIDRAFPEQISMTLRNLKLLLESPECVFLLAMDLDIVAQSLETIYRNQSAGVFFTNINNSIHDSRETTLNYLAQPENGKKSSDAAQMFGYSYLEKLIQIHVRVPPLTRTTIHEYLKDIGIADEVLEIIQYAPDEILNPRRLKRYVNWLSISLQLIVASPLPSPLNNLKTLRYLALKHDYPDVYKKKLQGEKFEEDVSPQLKRYLWWVSEQEIHKFETFLNKAPVLSAARVKV
jgi:KAP family P-loop domain